MRRAWPFRRARRQRPGPTSQCRGQPGTEGLPVPRPARYQSQPVPRASPVSKACQCRGQLGTKGQPVPRASRPQGPTRCRKPASAEASSVPRATRCRKPASAEANPVPKTSRCRGQPGAEASLGAEGQPAPRMKGRDKLEGLKGRLEGSSGAREMNLQLLSYVAALLRPSIPDLVPGLPSRWHARDCEGANH
jgi:hypothetical protein